MMMMSECSGCSEPIIDNLSGQGQAVRSAKCNHHCNRHHHDDQDQHNDHRGNHHQHHYQHFRLRLYGKVAQVENITDIMEFQLGRVKVSLVKY